MDSRFPGVKPRGKGWQIDFTLADGTRRREVVRHPLNRTGENLANRDRQAILSEIDRGIFSYAKWFPRSKYVKDACNSGDLLIAKGLRIWLREAEKRCARSTFRDYASAVHHHLIPSFGYLKLSELRPSLVREWRIKQEISAKRINNVLIPLRQLSRQAFEDESLHRDPMALVRNLSPRTKEADPFTAEEQEKLLAALEAAAPEVRRYFAFALETGLRTGELIAVQHEDVDLVQRRVRVSHNSVRGDEKGPKTASGVRWVDLSDHAVRVVEEQRNLHVGGALFRDPRSGKAWRNDQAQRKVFWYPALERAGLRRRVPYQTRHTFASTLLSQGFNPLYVAEQMGHRDWGTIRKIYGRWVAPAKGRRTGWI